ncbi:prostatic steroid-binding protein C1-like [Apodemus sylvaticus]|uniref:prostatic steroid-binding protein C1-like n=1 Tax=Apodemus sylvaticus TaxID=10129 RepID=UPI002242329D|nr:prostatic steroid-binding protein C1-like [Apodemus sylvaticus]
MKLSLCLLIILAVCCYEVNTDLLCEAVAHESISLLLNSEKEVKKELEIYNASQAAVEAKLKVKRCVDQMSDEDKFIVAERWAQIILDCSVNAWIDTYYPEIDFLF